MKTLLSVFLLTALTGCSAIGVCANFEECRQRGWENRVYGTNTSQITRLEVNGTTHIINSSTGLDSTRLVRVTTVGKK